MSRTGRGGDPRRSARAREKIDRRATAAATLEPLGVAMLALWALALLLASPHRVDLWGINGFRSVPAQWPALVLAAGVSLALAVFRPRAVWVWSVVLAVLTWALALPFRERVHFLGDTQLRLRALFAVSLPSLAAGIGGVWNWIEAGSRVLHAGPLDMIVDVLPVLVLHARGFTASDAVAIVTSVLALAYFALAWRLAGRLAPDPSLRGPLALALSLAGTLEAFAGYADSAALIGVATLAWWGEMLAPLDRPARAWRLSVAFVALLLAHRMAIVMLLPQLLRALGPGLPGDRPAVRRALLGLIGLAVALAIALAMAEGVGPQLARDVTELLRSLRPWPARLLDVLSALIVVAPLAIAAPALAGRAGAEFRRDPRALWIVVGAAPLLLGLIWVFPVGENGLGAHRDWDTNVLLGVTLTVGAAIWLARAGAPRLQRALTAALPLLTLTALGWLAANADPIVATRRAIELDQSLPALTAPQHAHLDMYFGQRAMDEHRADVAALHYQHAFDVAGNPRRALLAAEAWWMAGHPTEARAAIARARSAGPLPDKLESGARELESRLAADSTAPSTR